MGLGAETDILGHAALKTRSFRGTSDNFSEHFFEKAYSGEEEALDAKLGHTAESVGVAWEGALLTPGGVRDGEASLQDTHGRDVRGGS